MLWMLKGEVRFSAALDDLGIAGHHFQLCLSPSGNRRRSTDMVEVRRANL